MTTFVVQPIRKDVYARYLLHKHYAGRLCSVSFAYGLYIDGVIQGVCTIGKPTSNSLCVGILGEDHKHTVFELNRLCIEDGLPRNTLSRFVGEVLRNLKHLDLCLVSYADTAMQHHGYIYQATNWLYTGATKQRTDKYTPNGKHSRHCDDSQPNLRKVRSSKHRYVYFTKRKTLLQDCLRYKVEPYPKGDNTRYVLGYKLTDTIIEVNT